MSARIQSFIVTALIGAMTGAAPVHAAGAFRINSLALRDPHITTRVIGCLDITNTNVSGGQSFNGQLADLLSLDSDSDGNLDLSDVLVLDPLDPAGATTSVTFGQAVCTAPAAGTACTPSAAFVPYFFTGANASAGTCLTTVPGTTHPYTPAITTPSAPCFSTNASDLTLALGWFQLPLHDCSIGATYVGSPPTALVNGLIRGFLRSSDASAITLPTTVPLIGGLPLASVLPGGSGNCSSVSDLDSDQGTPGWWFYFNFTAGAVPYSVTAVSSETPRASLALVAAYPNPSTTTATIRYALPAAAPIRLSIHDAQGRLVRELEAGAREAGDHAATWDGRDADHRLARSGVYVIRLEAQGGVCTRLLAVVR